MLSLKKVGGGPQFYCDFFEEKKSLGGILIVLVIHILCKDKSMVGYNLLAIYFKNHRNFCVAIQKVCGKKSH